MPSFDTPFPPRAMPAPIANSGRKTVRAPNGSNVSMQMRSFEIRSLDDRIRYLERLVDEGKRDPQVYAFARRALTKKCGRNWCIDEKDNVREAQALFNAVRKQHPAKMSPAELATAKTLFQNIRKNVRYTSDILGVDTYQKPSHTLALHSGDCDDYSTLTCAALLSVGIPCRFVVIRTKGAGDWNHIYPEAGFPRANPTKWVPMDSSVKMPFGWAAPPRMVAAKRTFRIR
jgi:transglutaminase-like putative cysteine protease